LYEGVTEWARDIIQLRAGTIGIEDYLDIVSEKIGRSEDYHSDWSLTQLSSGWFADEGRTRYGDVYQLGAVTAACLDIRLLQLSGGARGLREVLLELIGKYGRDRPFDNAAFFDEIVAMTYPEIAVFINDHIRNRKPLDYEHYFDLIGVRYVKSRPSSNPLPLLGMGFYEESGGQVVIASASSQDSRDGPQEGDVVLELFGQEVNTSTLDSVLDQREGKRPGDPFTIRVLRGGEELEFEGRLIKRLDYHVLEVEDEITETQRRLRDSWMRNLNARSFPDQSDAAR
jgi:predicted metalloprotease with PDZ domain